MTYVSDSFMIKSFFLIFFLLNLGFIVPLFAQHHENPPASLGDREAVMDFIFPDNIKPNEDFTLTLSLYDKSNNQNFKNVSIQLAVLKNGFDKYLMNELFYDENGQITIDFKSKSFNEPDRKQIKAATEPFLGGWMKDYGSNIQVMQNIFSENAIYTLKATVVTIDTPRQFIDKPLTFTSQIHLGMNHTGNAEIHIPDWVRNNAKWWSEGSIADKDFASGIQFMIKEGIITIPVIKNDQSTQEIHIPDWVRNNAKWWSEGSIADKDFASGIQFMIKEGIITIPVIKNDQSTQEIKIPDWVRNNAKWWSEGSIADKDFASGIQYLVKVGIINV